MISCYKIFTINDFCFKQQSLGVICDIVKLIVTVVVLAKISRNHTTFTD